MLSTKIRDGLSGGFRRLPPFRGKASIGDKLTSILTRDRSDKSCIIPVKMRDGSRMMLDVRSRTERWAVYGRI